MSTSDWGQARRRWGAGPLGWAVVAAALSLSCGVNWLDGEQVAEAPIPPCGQVGCPEGACYECGVRTPTDPPPGSSVYPDGLDPNEPVHWTFDPNQPPLPQPIDGDGDHAVTQSIEAGKVKLTFADGAGAQAEAELAAPAWNFFPMATAAPGGRYLVCWTRFTGAPSGATAGGTPDPRNGSANVCRHSTDGGKTWAAEFEVPHATRTAWLTDVRWDRAAGTYFISTYEDVYGTFLNDWNEEMRFTRSYDGGTLGPKQPELADASPQR